MNIEMKKFDGDSFGEVIRKACSHVNAASVAELDVVSAKTGRKFWFFGKKLYSLVVRTARQNVADMVASPSQSVRDFAKELFRLAGFDLEVSVKQSDQKIVAYLSGKDLGIVLDKNNPVHEGLEHLFQRALSRKLRRSGEGAQIDVSVVCQNRNART